MSKRVIVHVARQAVASNVKHGRTDPTIIVRRGKTSSRHHRVKLVGDVEIVSAFDGVTKPLACGARVWMTADDAIPLDEPVELADAA